MGDFESTKKCKRKSGGAGLGESTWILNQRAKVMVELRISFSESVANMSEPYKGYIASEILFSKAWLKLCSFMTCRDV